MELAMNILQGKPYKKDNVMKSFLATPENCDAIALQYQDLEAKMKNRIRFLTVLILIQRFPVSGNGCF